MLGMGLGGQGGKGREHPRDFLEARCNHPAERPDPDKGQPTFPLNKAGKKAVLWPEPSLSEEGWASPGS